MEGRKSFRILILIILMACMSATLSADMVDLVVLLDVSESMFPYYDATVEYLLKDIIQKHLKPGDTFHLISFSDVPEREINRSVKTNEDVDAILDRITLLQPLGQYTDLILSLRYLYQYTANLSLRTKKNILILTDGIHDPPPGSSYPADTPEQIERNKQTAKDIAERLKREGWDISLVEFPRDRDSATPESEKTGMDVYDTLSDSLDVTVLEYSEEKNGTLSHEATGAPSLSFPDKTLKGNRTFTIPFKVENFKNESILIKLDEIIYDGTNILSSPVQKRIGASGKATLRAKVEVPEMEKGIHRLNLSLVFSDNLRIFPRTGYVEYKYSSISFAWLKYVLLAAAAVIVIFLLIRFIITPIRLSISTSIERDRYNKSIGLKPKKKEDEKESGTTRISDAVLTGKGITAAASTSHQKGSQKDGKIGLLSLEPNRKHSTGVPLMSGDISHKESGKIPLSSLTADSTSLVSNKEVQHYPIEMRVFGQNPLIGNRNIHWIGQRIHSIGGRGSGFYIFLYKVPANIANIRFSPGKGFIFTPEHPEYFPGLSGVMEDCINKPIHLKTAKGDELVIVFHEWISPLERINRILSLTKHSGSVELPEDL